MAAQARLVYFMLTKGQAFVEAGQENMKSGIANGWYKIWPSEAAKWASNSNPRSYGPHDFRLHKSRAG